MRKIIFLFLMSIVLLGASEPTVITEGSTKIFKNEGWELRITHRAEGTRSEGRHGRLFKDSKEVFPNTEHEVLKTPIGEVKYYLDESQRKHLWDTSGWHFVDTKKW